MQSLFICDITLFSAIINVRFINFLRFNLSHIKYKVIKQIIYMN